MNKRELQEVIIKYLLLGILLIGFTCIYAGIGLPKKSDGNLIIALIGVLILSPFVIHFLYWKWQSKKQIKLEKLELEEFKIKAIKVAVNLENVKIKSNTWTNLIERPGIEYEWISALTGNGQRNIDEVQIGSNYVKIKIPYKGKVLTRNFEIGMDPTILKLHFAAKKETTLYIDPKNPKLTYLDLEFLE